MNKRRLLGTLPVWVVALVLSLGNLALAQTAYEPFAGYVVNSSGNPVAAARVTVNKVSGTTGADGYFELYAPADSKYLISATATGFVPYSRTYSGPGVEDMVLRLTPGESFTIDTTQPVNVTDSQGSRIQLPAGALVRSNGSPPTGPITMTVHTYDLRSEQMVGDMSALDISGQPVVLQSIGAVSVDFTDSAGNVYNLAPGKRATLTVLTDPGNPYAGSIPMWWYDTARGVWIEEGQGTVQNGVATAQVSHFTVWNFDMKFPSPSCVKITASLAWWSSYLSTYGVYPQIRVTVPSPWYRVQTLPINNSGNHVIYNLANNINLMVEVLNPSTNQWDPYAIVNTGAPWGGTGMPLLSQYNQCKGALTLNGAPTVGKVVGQVRRQHRSLHGGVAVQVTLGSSTFSATTDNNGNFSVVVPAGSGSARASLLGYLSAQRGSVSVSAGATATLPLVTLLAGDVDGNNCVNTADTGAINNAVGTAASANDPRNVNGDTWIYYDDLGLASFNGGLCGPMGW